MSPVPVAFLVDDPTPVLHLYRHHIVDISRKTTLAAGGVPLTETIPNAFLGRFCDVVEARGIKGKFSIVPEPQGRGDVVRGIEGFDQALTREWMSMATGRLAPFMDFCPEMLTHSWAVDLAQGKFLPETEHDWSQHQTRATLAPYIVRALSILKEAGVDATGVTSPWMFGADVEREYVAAIAEAQRTVHGRTLSWYFLHIKDDPVTKPWVAYRDEGSTCVSVATCSDDLLWDTIWKHAGADRALIASLADGFLTANGRAGLIRRVLDAGGWPVFLAHWQTLWSNGHETGLAVLDEVGKRIHGTLGGAVEWTTCLGMAKKTVEGLPAGSP
jgi:hypothetical protein